MERLLRASFIARISKSFGAPRSSPRRPIATRVALPFAFLSFFVLVAIPFSDTAYAQTEMLPLASAITLNASPHNDGTVTFETTVTGRNGLTPNGSVKIVDETTQNLVGFFDASDSEIRVPQLAAGPHQLRAYYSGSDAYFPYVVEPSVSGALVYNVKMSSSVDLAVLQNEGGAGELVTLTATVSDAAAPSRELSGLVAFKDGDRVLATQRLDRSGQTSFVTTALEQGAHRIVAQYEGGETFAPAVSAVRIVSVGPADADTEQRSELPSSFALNASEWLDTN